MTTERPLHLHGEHFWGKQRAIQQSKLVFFLFVGFVFGDIIKLLEWGSKSRFQDSVGIRRKRLMKHRHNDKTDKPVKKISRLAEHTQKKNNNNKWHSGNGSWRPQQESNIKNLGQGLSMETSGTWEGYGNTENGLKVGRERVFSGCVQADFFFKQQEKEQESCSCLSWVIVAGVSASKQLRWTWNESTLALI